MISLKKNDKIIIIAAVVILVFAGVGVAMYQSPETPDIPLSTIGEKSFEIIWSLENDTLGTITDFASKKTMFEEVVSIPDTNVKCVVFNLTWTDDHMTMLKRMGLDTLTLEITTPDGATITESGTSARLTGDGCINRSVTVGIIPPSTPIKADDEKAAYAKLMGKPYSDDSWTNKDIKINIGVHVGEMRILKKLRDKGNDFELTISYQYYKGDLKVNQDKSTGENNDDTILEDDPWAEQTTPPYISMIINTGCGRFV